MFHFLHGRVLETRSPGIFEPARPEPASGGSCALAIALRSRRNLLANWRSEHYRSGVFSFRILGRQVVLANTPDSVKEVLATPGDTFERKSPQMRRALELLLGDGLFISDGETWRRRRPLVADPQKPGSA